MCALRSCHRACLAMRVAVCNAPAMYGYGDVHRKVLPGQWNRILYTEYGRNWQLDPPGA